MAIIGLDNLKSELLKISKAVHDEVLPEAIGAAAEVIKTEMELKAPKLTGFLSMHIQRQKVQSKALTGSQVIGERVGPSKEAFYALFLEYGHVAAGRGGKPTSMERKGKRPFIRPTADEAGERAQQAAEQAAKAKLSSMGIN